MLDKKLHLYRIDTQYVQELAKVDNMVMSVSTHEHKETRPFIAIVFIMNCKKYCVPLTSPKPKHKRMKNSTDFYKISDKNHKPLGALNFNNMIPVSDEYLHLIDINFNINDSPNQKKYKQLLRNQLNWCNKNSKTIIEKANKLYQMITETPEKYPKLVSRCCDFKKLEGALEEYINNRTATSYEINKTYTEQLDEDDVLDLTIEDENLGLR